MCTGHSCPVVNDITVQITAKGQIGGQNVSLCLESLGKAGEGHRRWVSEIMGKEQVMKGFLSHHTEQSFYS